MRIEQTLSDEENKKSILSHFNSDTVVRYSPFIGALIVVVSMTLYLTQPGWSGMPLLALGGGFVLVMKRVLVAYALRGTRNDPRYSKPISIEFSDNGTMKVSTENENSVLQLSNLFGYRISAPGLLLYFRRNIFYPLKLDAIERAGGMNSLTGLLDDAGVKRLV